MGVGLLKVVEFFLFHKHYGGISLGIMLPDIVKQIDFEGFVDGVGVDLSAKLRDIDPGVGKEGLVFLRNLKREFFE